MLGTGVPPPPPEPLVVMVPEPLKVADPDNDVVEKFPVPVTFENDPVAPAKGPVPPVIVIEPPPLPLLPLGFSKTDTEMVPVRVPPLEIVIVNVPVPPEFTMAVRGALPLKVPLPMFVKTAGPTTLMLVPLSEMAAFDTVKVVVTVAACAAAANRIAAAAARC
jgi:hypothetical protein